MILLKIGDNVILNNKSAHKYKTPNTGSFKITQTWNNRAITLQTDPTIGRYNDK